MQEHRSRPVVPGCAGCAMAHTDFGRSVQAGGGTDYAHLITTGTPGFSDLPTALSIKLNCRISEALTLHKVQISVYHCTVA